MLVNDVAAVNVDAMSLRRTKVEAGEGIGMVQLENGCVCCSAAGDLVPAVLRLPNPRNPPLKSMIEGGSKDSTVEYCDTFSTRPFYSHLAVVYNAIRIHF